MATYSFLIEVDLSEKYCRKVYNFIDFIGCLTGANRKVGKKFITTKDIVKWQDYTSSLKDNTKDSTT